MTQLTYNELLENYKLLIGLVMDLKAEKEAYMRVVQEELESGDDHDTDYVRLQQAKEKWKKAADAQLEARRRWGVERYEVKSKIATLMGKETNYEWRKVKEQKWQ